MPTNNGGIAECNEKEFAIVSAITGQPHCHILYSRNSDLSWLRKMVRQRMNKTDDNPVETAINQELNIIRECSKMLRLSEF